ncbi:hypothetical protein PHMEG_00019715 [Phytophthora megakarya]|uniref:Uncharacterized protein n=1 Tax=Phytophthora megakarya TaxID=4795 RepID=A0A225VS45_9STRA|nr:hypothetical protein PHMEG_00019715 [Phytophthora megakarya]
MADRYNNDELIAYTKVIINSQVKLPKLHTKGDYKAWRSEVPLHFDSRMLGDITYGPERYDEQEGLPEIRDNKNAAAMLYERVTQHFEAGDCINSDYLLQELVTRKLKHNDAVANYVDHIAPKVTQLHQANGEFQDLAREYGDWINNNDRKSLPLADALPHLRGAEHQRPVAVKDKAMAKGNTGTAPLADQEWKALQELSTVIGEAAVATMLRTLSPTEHMVFSGIHL